MHNRPCLICSVFAELLSLVCASVCVCLSPPLILSVCLSVSVSVSVCLSVSVSVCLSFSVSLFFHVQGRAHKKEATHGIAALLKGSIGKTQPGVRALTGTGGTNALQHQPDGHGDAAKSNISTPLALPAPTPPAPPSHQAQQSDAVTHALADAASPARHLGRSEQRLAYLEQLLYDLSVGDGDGDGGDDGQDEGSSAAGSNAAQGLPSAVL